MSTKLTRIDLVILAVFLSVYSLFSFYNLGNHKATGFWYGAVTGKYLTITFAKPQRVGGFGFYGCNSLERVAISYTTTNGDNGLVAKLDGTKGYGFCRGNLFDVDSNKTYQKITIFVNKPFLSIGQILILDDKKLPVINYSVSGSIDPNIDDLSGVFWNTSGTTPNIVYNGMFYDESAYALMGYYYLHGIPIFNLAHPQLGMLLIGLGMDILGFNPFGWRFMAALSGILLLGVIYNFAKKLTGRTFFALFAMAILSVDFMHFTISRLALIEPFVTLFILLTYFFLYDYCMLRDKNSKQAIQKLFCCGMYLGLAMSCKLTGAFAFPLIIACVIYFENNSRKKLSVIDLWMAIKIFIAILVVPLVIYTLSYVPMLIIEHSHNYLVDVIKIQNYMFNFHIHDMLNPSSYIPPWWTWSFNLHPLSLSYRDNDGVVNSVALMGNPFIWWLFLPVLSIGSILFTLKKDLKVGFLILTIIVQYLPYAFLHRVSFEYYFYSIIPLFVLLMTLLASFFVNKFSWLKNLLIIYIIVCITMTIIYSPLIAGFDVPKWYVEKLQLFSTWQFNQ